MPVVVESLNFFNRELNGQVRSSEACFQADVVDQKMEVRMHPVELDDLAQRRVDTELNCMHPQLEFASCEEVLFCPTAPSHRALNLVFYLLLYLVT